MRKQAWTGHARWLVLGLWLVAGAAHAGQKQVGGVRMPDSLTLQGRTVALAHMELHKRFFFKVYVWSLYLEDQPRNASEAIASDSVKRLHFRFLRDISRAQLVDSLRHGLVSRNPHLREGPLAQQLGVMLASLRDVGKGGDLIITYTPDGGLEVGGEASGGVFIPGKSFADALFAVWLDAHPIFPR
ncbi:chalcone isomerase family protein [Myxococcus stipitatus]|uniref:chalcone isomerase family protein n=1 Tax=Myxococcus stipitatus TaxID=83455 RepID=UPI001F33F87A|nr:chalcone isomerase family protein [Myxococcus stipitatus]MCE9673115.1 chalcone isomerase family protein [Myxococcus stipitatus]